MLLFEKIHLISYKTFEHIDMDDIVFLMVKNNITDDEWETVVAYIRSLKSSKLPLLWSRMLHHLATFTPPVVGDMSIDQWLTFCKHHYWEIYTRALIDAKITVLNYNEMCGNVKTIIEHQTFVNGRNIDNKPNMLDQSQSTLFPLVESLKTTQETMLEKIEQLGLKREEKMGKTQKTFMKENTTLMETTVKALETISSTLNSVVKKTDATAEIVQRLHDTLSQQPKQETISHDQARLSLVVERLETLEQTVRGFLELNKTFAELFRVKNEKLDELLNIHTFYEENKKLKAELENLKKFLKTLSDDITSNKDKTNPTYIQKLDEIIQKLDALMLSFDSIKQIPYIEQILSQIQILRLQIESFVTTANSSKDEQTTSSHVEKLQTMEEKMEIAWQKNKWSIEEQKAQAENFAFVTLPYHPTGVAATPLEYIGILCPETMKEKIFNELSEFALQCISHPNLQGNSNPTKILTKSLFTFVANADKKFSMKTSWFVVKQPDTQQLLLNRRVVTNTIVKFLPEESADLKSHLETSPYIPVGLLFLGLNRFLGQHQFKLQSAYVDIESSKMIYFSGLDDDKWSMKKTTFDSIQDFITQVGGAKRNSGISTALENWDSEKWFDNMFDLS
jgi:hypothetical protein